MKPTGHKPISKQAALMLVLLVAASTLSVGIPLYRADVHAAALQDRRVVQEFFAKAGSEIEKEVGELRLVDGEWVVRFDEARTEHRKIMQENVLFMLDRKDDPYLRSAIGNYPTLKPLIDEVLGLLPESAQEPLMENSVFVQAGAKLRKIAGQISDDGPRARPLLLRTSFHQHIVAAAKRSIDELDRLVRDYERRVSFTNGVVRKTKLNPKETNDSCESICRHSRVSFLLVSVVYDAGCLSSKTFDRMKRSQEAAKQLVEAVANSQAFAEGLTSFQVEKTRKQFDDQVKTYAKSIRRRADLLSESKTNSTAASNKP